MIKKTVLLALLFSSSLFSGQCKHLILKGLGGGGGDNHNVNNIINEYNGHETIMLDYPQTMSDIDLGQGRCIKHFLDQLHEIDGSGFALYGTSQGTATIINSLKSMGPTHKDKIKLIFLESVLGTPNSAIMHNPKAAMLAYFPFARLWIPGIVKIMAFPSLNLLRGPNTLGSAQYVPNHVPVVIMHDTQDPILSINDARRLYIKLLENNKKVYLFEVTSESGSHVDILGQMSNEEQLRFYKAALQQILCNAGLPYDTHLLKSGFKENQKEVDLTLFQPSKEDVQERIDSIDDSLFYNILDCWYVFAIGAIVYYKWAQHWF